MEEYTNNLIKQFMYATGAKNKDVNSDEFIGEFLEWIISRQKIGEKYTDFLDYMGFKFYTSDCAEVNKGDFDSVVKPFDTTIITQDISIIEADPNRIVKGKMMVYDCMPYLITKEKNKERIRPILNESIHTFMTQNPFLSDRIFKWKDLHNSGSNDIILGVYGSLHDKDLNRKIETLKSFRDELISGDYKEDYVVSGDDYFYVVGSDRTVKKYKYKYKYRDNNDEIRRLR